MSVGGSHLSLRSGTLPSMSPAPDAISYRGDSPIPIIGIYIFINLAFYYFRNYDIINGYHLAI